MSQREIGIEEARRTLGDLVDQVRYTGQTITLTRHGKPAARLVPMEDTTTTTTSYGTWVNHTSGGNGTVAGTVTDHLGEFVEEHDVDAIVTEFADEINAVLPDGVSLHGDEFYGPAGQDRDSDAIREAIESVTSP